MNLKKLQGLPTRRSADLKLSFQTPGGAEIGSRDDVLITLQVVFLLSL